ncbi:MAG: GxxExxY protein [Lacunisphaera sp.]|nr:GxxExxY protein [Lacunisphaera sp.]
MLSIPFFDYTEITENHRVNTEINQLTEQIIGAAIEVHRELGPGLLESAYQRALAHELRLRGLVFEEQKLCPIKYKDLLVDDAYRLDFLVGGLVVVELKTVDALLDVHDAQVLTYLKFTGCRVGLLLNFRSMVLIRGLRRLAL